MDAIFVVEQLLNGLGQGLMLFLLAAGLTLVFGIMDTMNLAHGSLYMAGAYIAARVHQVAGSFVGAVLIAMAATALVAFIVELLIVRRLYHRDHLAQVIATFGLILIADDAVKAIWGPSPILASTPAALAGPVQLLAELPYPAYRLVLLGVGLLVAVGLYLLVNHTRVGMLVRAGATNRQMVRALGVNIQGLYTAVFALGALLAGLAGVMASPIVSVQVGMGDEIILATFVVVVIGGVGSVKGAFVAGIVLGMFDTMLRAFLPGLLQQVMPGPEAQALGVGVSSMGIYLMMALVLLVRPRGLFAARG